MMEPKTHNMPVSYLTLARCEIAQIVTKTVNGKDITPPQPAAPHVGRQTHGRSVLISARSAVRQALRLRRRPSDGSCRSLRAWPGGGVEGAEAGIASLCRRLQKAAMARKISHTVYVNNKPSSPQTRHTTRFSAAAPVLLAARNSQAPRSNLGRPRTGTEGAGLRNHPCRPGNPGPVPVLLSPRRRASPSPMPGSQQLTTAFTI